MSKILTKKLQIKVEIWNFFSNSNVWKCFLVIIKRFGTSNILKSNDLHSVEKFVKYHYICSGTFIRIYISFFWKTFQLLSKFAHTYYFQTFFQSFLCFWVSRGLDFTLMKSFFAGSWITIFSGKKINELTHKSFRTTNKE